MNSQEARIFVTRFVQGKYSQEDHESFLGWVRDAPIDQIDTLAREYETLDIPGLAAGPSELWKAQLEQKIDRLETASQPVPMKHSPVSRRWRSWAAAAAVILVGGSLYFYLINVKEETATPNKDKGAANVKPAGIVPGANKATLILADGSAIALNEAGNGLLTQQGQTRITLVNNKELVYQPVSEERSGDLLYNTVVTPRGGQYQLTLPDQTKIWLNAESSIRFPVVFSGKERRVQITGEVYFEVARNPSMPFKAVIGSSFQDMANNSRGRGEVEVVGTHFNIKAYGDEPGIETTLLKGSVKVVKGGFVRVLKPDEQARMDTSTEGNAIRVVNLGEDADKTVNWKEGYFSGPKISAIMEQIARWYDVEVIYEGGKLPEGNFEGRLSRSTSIKSLLNTLKLNGLNAELNENERKIIVKS